MNLRLKLVAIIAFVALVPLVVSAVTMLSVHQRALDGATAALHGKLAEHGASLLRSYFATNRRTLELTTGAIEWQTLNTTERDGALWLVYRQLPDIAAVALLDGRGEGLGRSVYREPHVDDDLIEHPPASMALLDGLSRRIPLEVTQRDGFAVGEAFAVDGYSRPFVPLGVRVRGSDAQTWIIAVGVSLARLCDELGAAAPDGITLHAVDPASRTLCGSEAFGAKPGMDAPQVTTLARLGEPGSEKLAAASAAEGGWWVVAEQPVADAFAASRRIRQQTFFWIAVSLAIAVVAGLVLARGISQPVAQLVQAARELAEGNFAFRANIAGDDEFARLGKSFNHMSEEVERRDRDIRGWNAELEQRVTDRTHELREAEEQLLQSQKMAAVTALGAGIAHEINNPLAGVLGVVQVVRAKLAKEAGRERVLELLDGAEKESLRIKDIVQRFLAFSRNQGDEQLAPLDVHRVLDETMVALQQQFTDAGIVTERHYGVGLPEIAANRGQLREAFVQILRNSIQAMAAGGTLSLRTDAIENGAVRIAIADTGGGIAPENLTKIFEPFFTTKANDWRGEGLGLTVAYRIVESHHGKIKAESVLANGTTMTIVLPAASGRAHLV